MAGHRTSQALAETMWVLPFLSGMGSLWSWRVTCFKFFSRLLWLHSENRPSAGTGESQERNQEATVAIGLRPIYTRS